MRRSLKEFQRDLNGESETHRTSGGTAAKKRDEIHLANNRIDLANNRIDLANNRIDLVNSWIDLVNNQTDIVKYSNFQAAVPPDVRKGSAFPINYVKSFEAAPHLPSSMIKISRDTPCYYLTSVAKDRLPVFQTDKIKQIVCKALDEARNSAEILIFAYVLMPDHIHLITDGAKDISEVLRYTNGITAKRVIDFLKENNYTSSLLKLRQETKSRNYKHSLFEHHPNAFSINNEGTFMQKVNYIHQNPVRAKLVERAEDYKFSSAKIWRRMPLDNEPLKVDIDKIEWRKR